MAAPVERTQGILDPQSVVSNKICLAPVVQQVVGAVMLYKLIVLLFDTFAYKGAVNARQAVEKQHNDRIAPMQKLYDKHIGDVADYRNQLTILNDPKGREDLNALIGMSQNAAEAEHSRIEAAQIERDNELSGHDRIVAEKKAVCKQDKEYLLFAVSRLTPGYGSYVSWKQLSNLPQAAAAA